MQMNKKLIFISFFLVFKLFSQNKKNFDYQLLGTVILDSKDVLSYKMDFNVDNKGKLFGYSYTDITGENETKSYVKGYYDKKTRKVNFYEEDILYTKSKYLPEDFCFINFKGKFKIKESKKVLDGDFVGIFKEKDTCAKGRIKLVGVKFVEKKIKKLHKKIEKKKRIDSVIKKELTPEVYLKKFSETRIKSGEKVSVFVYTSKMKLELWDYGKEDGDVIDVYLNGKRNIVELYCYKKEKEIYC